MMFLHGFSLFKSFTSMFSEVNVMYPSFLGSSSLTYRFTDTQVLHLQLSLAVSSEGRVITVFDSTAEHLLLAVIFSDGNITAEAVCNPGQDMMTAKQSFTNSTESLHSIEIRYCESS